MPTINVNVNVNISAGADNGVGPTVIANGLFDTGNAHYSGTYFWAGVALGGGLERGFAALRFRNVNIPQGAHIVSATLNMVKTNSKGAPVLNIFGNNIDNAPAWGPANRVHNIAKTPHSTPLDVTDANSINNVTAIVQDIVNRGGWLANNAMAFGVFNTMPGGVSVYWSGAAYARGGANIPNLSVRYLAPNAVAANGLRIGLNFYGN